MRCRLRNIEPTKPESSSSVLERSNFRMELILISLLAQYQKKQSRLDVCDSWITESLDRCHDSIDCYA
jgi:hypothetical protein